TAFDASAKQVKRDVHNEIKDAGKHIELDSHEVTTNHLLCFQQKLSHADHGQEACTLDEFDAGVDPWRKSCPQSLRQKHVCQQLRKGKSDSSASLGLPWRNRLQGAAHELTYMRPGKQGKRKRAG